MKRVYFILVSLFFCTFMSAQNVVEKTKKEINRIKLSRAYICAEATMPTLDEALNEAKEALILAIEQWAKEEKKYTGAIQIATQDIKSCVEKLTMNRGSNVRVLAYTLKKDIIPIYGNLIHLDDDEQEEGQGTIMEVSPKESVVATNTTATTTTKKELKQELKTTTSQSISKPKPKVPKKALQRIIEAQTMDEIKVIFQELKATTGIVYGKMTSADLDVQACCLLFYNREGKVVGVLGEGDQERMNLRTNQLDKLSNYSGNAAYWFVVTQGK